DQLVALVATLDGLFSDGPDPADVDLVVHDARLEGRGLLHEHRAAGRDRGRANRGAQAEDREAVLGVAHVVLLPAPGTGLGVGGHEYAGASAVAAGAERALAAPDPAVPNGRRVLAQIPDVAGPVLRVVVVGRLGQAAALVDAVVDDRCPNAQDELGVVGDAEHVTGGG